MSTPASDGPIAALNQVLSEVIDLVQDVKQAHRKVPETAVLHAELDRLFEDLRSWAGGLLDQDRAVGVSPLASMPSVAGRRPQNLWPGDASDDDVRRVLGQDLDRLAHHVDTALAGLGPDPADAGDAGGGVRSALTAVQQGLQTHARALAEA